MFPEFGNDDIMVLFSYINESHILDNSLCP